MTPPSASDRADRAPLLAEWACLGVLYGGAQHGWAVAQCLRPDGAIGRVWTVSRPLTYRSLGQLATRGWVQPVGSEPGTAGPNRTILATTRSGRTALRRWVRTPVEHLRDLRSELLLKLVFAEQHGIDVTEMLAAQRRIVDGHVASHRAGTGDVVLAWRLESALAARRFLDRIVEVC